MKFRSTLFAVALTLLVCPPFVLAEADFNYKDPPQGTFVDDWYAVEFGDQKCGHMQSTVTRKADVITSHSDMQISFQRAGITIPMSVVSTAEETLDGKPLSVKNTTRMAAIPMVSEAKIRDGKVTVTTSQFGATQTATYDFPSTAKLPWAVLLEQARYGMEPGTEYTIDTYDPTMSPSKPVKTHVKIGNRRTVDLFGRKVQAVWSEQKLEFGATTLDSQAYLDDNGTPLKLLMPLAGLGIDLVLTKCPKAFALRKGSAPEMFLSSLIPIETALDRPTLQSAKFKLSLKGDKPADFPKIPETDMQTVTPGPGEGVLTVSIRRSDHAALAAAASTATTPDDAEYLKSSAFINHTDQVIRDMAAEAAGAEKKPYPLADRLRQFVSEKIVTKDLNVGFATAGEVARSKEGDCSEHAVLLAALGRACGLPSRVVSGIIYVSRIGSHERVFGFHMWTQFKIAGKWIDFDAAQHQTDCDPTHIALHISPLNDEGLADLSMSLLNLIGRLKVEVLATTP
jgi:hypothetical protein